MPFVFSGKDVPSTHGGLDNIPYASLTSSDVKVGTLQFSPGYLGNTWCG